MSTAGLGRERLSGTDLVLEEAGRATMQDLGRPGLGSSGIAVNGAADQRSSRTANILVGNAESSPLIEVTGTSLRFSTTAPALLSVTGAASRVLVDGHAAPSWEPFATSTGSRVHIDAPQFGLRSYVAVNGLMDAPAVLGSVAPDSLLGVSTVLTTGSVVHVRTSFAGLVHPHLCHVVFRLGATRRLFTEVLDVAVTDGPERDQFGGDAYTPTYVVTPQSDHVGLRVSGSTPARGTSSEILSRGVPVGAVEVPPSGGLLMLLRGRLVTAGYPVLAVATSSSIDDLGQLRPGDRLSMRQCSVTDAVAEARRRRNELDKLTERVRAAFTACGLASIMSDDH